MNFVSRAQWGARPPRSTSRIGAPYWVALHWEGPKMGWPWDHSQCAAKVRSIQKFHMDSRGWADIAYSALYCGHGYVFEGRGLGKRTAAQGTNSGNDHYYALCYLGGENDGFPEAAKTAGR